MQGVPGSRVDGGEEPCIGAPHLQMASLLSPRFLCYLAYFPESLSQKCVVIRSLYSIREPLELACLGLNPCFTVATSVLLSNWFVKWRTCWCLLHKGVVKTEWHDISKALKRKKVKIKVTPLCPTLCDPVDYAVHGILQARILEWVTSPFSRGSSQSRDRTQVSCFAGGFFTSWATKEAQKLSSRCLINVCWIVEGRKSSRRFAHTSFVSSFDKLRRWQWAWPLFHKSSWRHRPSP